MTPETVHLFAQLVRHGRSMLNAFEKWTNKQPRSETTRELQQGIAFLRAGANLVELEIARLDFDVPMAREATPSAPASAAATDGLRLTFDDNADRDDGAASCHTGEREPVSS